MKKLYFGTFILLIFVIFLAGCSDSHKDDEKNAAAVQPVENQKVSLQLQWVTQAQFAGYYVAKEKGWYRQEGLEVTIHPGGPDIVPVDLVAAGSRSFGTTLLADLAVSINKGKPVISIAQIQQNNGLRLLARKNSGISSPKDFIGKKVGVWLGGWEVQFNALLAQKNIPEENVKIVSQGFSMEPFLTGRLDVASAMIYNEYYMVLAAGLSEEELIIIDYEDYGLGFPGDVLFTSMEMKNNTPDLCLKMVRASMKGWQYAMEHQQEAAQIVVNSDRSGVAKQDHQIKMMEAIAMLVKGDGNDKTGDLQKEELSKMVRLLMDYNVLTSVVPPEKIFTPQFIEQIAK